MAYTDVLTATCTIRRYATPQQGIRGGDRPNFADVAADVPCRVLERAVEEVDQFGKRVSRKRYLVQLPADCPRLDNTCRIIASDPTTGVTRTLTVLGARDPTGIGLLYQALCDEAITTS
jgi:hypothetical protein